MTKSTLQKPSKKSKPKTLTQARLKELLHYDPETGIFTFRINRNRFKAGELAGYINDQGYLKLAVDGKEYRASRLAFLYMEGYTPEYEVDHINRDRNDDRWCNLRHVSRQCNARNIGIRSDNKSGIMGICWRKDTNQWKSYISIDGKLINITHSNKLIDAVKARLEAEKKYNFQNCNTTSSAYLYLKEHGEI